MKVSDNLQKALPTHAASKLVPDASPMTNDNKVALVNKYKTRIHAAVFDISIEERETKDVASMLLEAIFHHLGIMKERKHC